MLRLPSSLKKMKRASSFFLILFACCTGSAPTTVTIQTNQGETAFQVEIADTEAERSLGLMHRQSLAAGQGILFVFSTDTQTSFWMKDTSISLDLIFISAEGVVVDLIQDTQPFSESLLTPDVSYRLVLEVVAGTVAQKGIQVGDRVTLPQGVLGAAGPGATGPGTAGAGTAGT